MPDRAKKEPAIVLRQVSFVTSAAKVNQCPPEPMPEVAFAGRSNVGKSSLMNMLLARKNLVKVSSTPGRTQLLNFFRVNDAFHLVDLPGYGFAKAPAQVRRNWQALITQYLASREQLAAVVLLLDVRHLPSPEDYAVLELFREVGIPCLIAVTKADKLSQQQRGNQVRQIAKALSLHPGDVVPCSANTGLGRDPLWRSIRLFVDPPTFDLPEPTAEGDA